MSADAAPHLSLLIPTYRRAERVERSVRAWAAQRLDAPIEIVVVDDGSDDDTRQRLEAIAAADPRVRPTSQPNRGRAAARNAALALARGRYLAFLDDDVSPCDERMLGVWLDRAARDGGAWVARLRVPDSAARTPLQRAWRAHLEGGTAPRAEGADLGQGGFWFAALLLARDLLAQERFDERFGGYGWEDLELGYRLHRRGVRSRLLRAGEVWHDDPTTLATLERKHESFGAGGWQFVRAHPHLRVRLWTGTWAPIRLGKALLSVERRGAAARGRIAPIADDAAAEEPPTFARDLRSALEAAYARGVRLGTR